MTPVKSPPHYYLNGRGLKWKKYLQNKTSRDENVNMPNMRRGRRVK